MNNYSLNNTRTINKVKQKKIKGKNIHVVEFMDDDKIKITFRNNQSVLIEAKISYLDWNEEPIMTISDMVKRQEYLDWD